MNKLLGKFLLAMLWVAYSATLCVALPVGSSPGVVDAVSIGQGKTVLSWSLPDWAEQTGATDLDVTPSGNEYPIALYGKSGVIVNHLLGYRILKNGNAIHEGLLTQRNFTASESGYFEIESVYENGETNIAAFGQIDPPAINSGDRALTMDLTAVIQDSFPRVRVRTEVRLNDEAATGLPLDSFRVWEDDQEMTLLEHCFVDYTRPVDVIFVLDLSRSMEPRIQRISETLESIVDSLPSTIDAKFGIVRYGLNTNGALNTPPGWTRFPGSPTNETKDSLYSAARAQQRMDSLTLNTLTGGQEPAYQAILSAIRQTAWRINSERYIILVSDENNDTCRISPPIPAPLLNLEMGLRQIRFLTWCNFNVVCDCYDFCPQFGRCDTLVSFGCASGVTHWAPLFTGDLPVSLENDFLDLWRLVRSRLLSSYDLCYDSPACCENGNVHYIAGQAQSDGEVGGDTISYEMAYCPRFYWSPETQDLIDGPCQTPFQTLSFCGDFLNLDSTARLGTAILFYGHEAGGEMYPVPTIRPFPPIFPQRWCASIPADSVRGPYMYISARFFNSEGLPVYYPCDTSRICVQAAPQIFCSVPQIWRCEDLVVQVNATDLGGSIVSNQFCYSIPAQGFDTCFTMPGAPPWNVTIPYTRFMFDSVCVRANVTDNEGQQSFCGPHCRTPIAHVPQIAHTPPPFRLECTGFSVAALITDPRGDLASPQVEWQCGDSIVSTPLDPVAGFPNLYSASLPAQFVNESCTVIYRIIVSDHCFSTVTAGPFAVPAIPHCPVIGHIPVTRAYACSAIPLVAAVSDSGGDLQSVVFGWRCVGDTVWTEGPMIVDILGIYHGTIPAARADEHCDLEYYIRATDFCGCVRQVTSTIDVIPHPPILQHTPITARYDCHNVTFAAVAFDTVDTIADVFIDLWCDTTHYILPMAPQILPPNTYLATLPNEVWQQHDPGCQIRYSISARDNCGFTTRTNLIDLAVLPHVVTIAHDSVSNALACANVTLCAHIGDAGGDLAGGFLQWKCAADSAYTNSPLFFNPLTGLWCGTIPGNRPNATCDLDYRFYAADTCGYETTSRSWRINVTVNPPTILHNPITSRFDCFNQRICAWVYDTTYALATVYTDFYCEGGSDTFRVGMPFDLLRGYCTFIPDTLINVRPSCVVTYRITASNTCGETSQTAWIPIAVVPHAPIITHDSVSVAAACSPIQLCWRVGDAASDLSQTLLWWKCAEDTVYSAVVPIFNPLFNIWCATISGNRPDALCDIDYFISAQDGCHPVVNSRTWRIDVQPSAPLILHQPLLSRLDCFDATICAFVYDSVYATASVVADFYCTGMSDTFRVNMPYIPLLGYCTTIPDTLVNTYPHCVFSYRITATNTCGERASTVWYDIQVIPHCPVITHTPVVGAVCNSLISVCATVTDVGDDFFGATLYWKCVGDTVENSLPLTFGPIGFCAHILPAQRPDNSCDIEYRIVARDYCGCESQVGPNTIDITSPPPVITVFSATRPDCDGAYVCAQILPIVDTLTFTTAQFTCDTSGAAISLPMFVDPNFLIYCAITPDSLVNIQPSCLIYWRVSAGNGCGGSATSVWTPIPHLPHCPIIVPLNVDTAFACEAVTACAIISDSVDALTSISFEWRCVGDSTSTFEPVSSLGTRRCGTIPANRSNGLCNLEYQFTATDSCGCTTLSGWWPITVTPHCPIITLLPVDSVLACDRAIACANIIDLAGDLASVTFEWRCEGDSIAEFGSIARLGGTYCGQIPADRPDGLCNLEYRFTATDSCGCVTQTSWYGITVVPHCPDFYDISFSGVFEHCREIPICATLTDAANDIAEVILYWRCVDDSVFYPLEMIYDNGDYCTTIPAYPPDGEWCPVLFKIIAEDSCGCREETGWLDIEYFDQPLVVSCLSLGSDSIRFDQDAFVCMRVENPGQGIEHVTLEYNTGRCDSVVAAHHSAGHYCATIPSECYPAGGGWLRYTFTAYDSCNRTESVTCSLWVTEPEHADLGDLPDAPYPTDNRFGTGPAHLITDVCWLGATIGFEDDPYGDVGLDPSDDGFSAECQTQIWGECSEVIFTVNVTTGTGYHGQYLYLSIWNDMNYDGDFLDDIPCPAGGSVNEWIVTSVDVVPGLNILSAIVNNVSPADGLNYIRVRLSTEPFAAGDYVDPTGVPRHDGEVEDYLLQCTTDACCFMCEASYATLYSPAIIEPVGGFNLVLRFESDGYLHLNWVGDPAAQTYYVYRGSIDDEHDGMEIVGSVLPPFTAWVDSTPRELLPARNFYQVSAHGVATRPAVPESDCARWEMNENSGEYADDATGNGHAAWRATPCPPPWGLEDDEDCYRETGYLNFPGYVGEPPNRCESHLEVENSDDFYDPSFQLWTRIRLTEEPTGDTGPFYIISNNSFDANGGGFMLRVDPAWITLPDGTREYHNRLTASVWDRNRYGLGRGGWWTIQSLAPTPADPTRGSLPLNEWACVCLVVDGVHSLILIDEQIVASGNLDFDSQNNDAPLIIGAGYRHSTYPIEYPFRGDIDCLRITCVLD